MNGLNETIYSPCIYVLDVGLNDLVELVMVVEGKLFPSGHPMHLHGHNFAVLGMEKV